MKHGHGHGTQVRDIPVMEIQQTLKTQGQFHKYARIYACNIYNMH